MRLTGGGQLRFIDFCKKLYREYEHDAVSDTSAQLSYYLLFSLFPFLYFMAALIAYLPLQTPFEQLMARMRPVVPRDAMALIDAHLRALVSQPRPRVLTLALVGSIWSPRAAWTPSAGRSIWPTTSPSRAPGGRPRSPPSA